MGQVDHKLDEVRAGKAVEYLSPLAQLQESMRIRTEVAGTQSDKITSPHFQGETVIFIFSVCFLVFMTYWIDLEVLFKYFITIC
jgi:hypothetical protein